MLGSLPGCPVGEGELVAEVSEPCVAVVGGGASTTFLLHALAQAGGLDRQVVVVDPSPRLGPGVAYGTSDPAHLMNVCRVRLSADGDGGEHLVGWLGERGIDAQVDTYLQRRVYGEYMTDVAERSADAVAAEHRRARVTGLASASAAGATWRVALDDGSALEASDVVLATGFPPRLGLPCPAPADDPRIVLDPWRAGVFDRPGLRRVLVVGTGLTMVDIALSLTGIHPDVEVHAISRRGLLPKSSRLGPPERIDPAELPEPGVGARDLIRHIVAMGRRHEDWQAVVDSVRPRANDLWRALSYGDQARILRRWTPWWNVHRHRTAPAVGARLDALIGEGRLHVGRGRLGGVDADAGDPAGEGGVRVRIDGEERRFDLVVDATGPSDDLSAPRDPTVASLLASGAAMVGPHRLGLAVDRVGRVIGSDGEPSQGLWLIGALRRGSEWETTAVPEIRAQGELIARRLAGLESDDDDATVGVGRC